MARQPDRLVTSGWVLSWHIHNVLVYKFHSFKMNRSQFFKFDRFSLHEILCCTGLILLILWCWCRHWMVHFPNILPVGYCMGVSHNVTNQIYAHRRFIPMAYWRKWNNGDKVDTERGKLSTDWFVALTEHKASSASNDTALSLLAHFVPNRWKSL